MEDPLLLNIPVAPLAAPVPIAPVAFNPAAPALTTSLLQDAYNRMMTPSPHGNITRSPSAQARIDQASQVPTAGGGQIAQSGGGGGGGGAAYSSNVPGQRTGVEGMRHGMTASLPGMRKNVEGMRENLEGMRKDVEGTRLLPNQGVLPNLGAYKYDKMGRRIK